MMRVKGSYTVEMAGIMAAVLFTMMVILNAAFHVRAEAVGGFTVHEQVERERHSLENMDESEITEQSEGQQWSMEITAPVFRPENSLRLWSLAEHADGTKDDG
jgi:hypothetical protein